MQVFDDNAPPAKRTKVSAAKNAMELARSEYQVCSHQQPEVNYLPRFSPTLMSFDRYTLSVYRTGEIDLFENLFLVDIRLLVVPGQLWAHGFGGQVPCTHNMSDFT